MNCKEPALFYQELKGAVAEYFCDGPVEERRTFRMFLMTLYGIFDTLEHGQNDPQDISCKMCLDGLSALCVNLPKAVQLGQLIQNYLSAIQKGGKAEVNGNLNEMVELVKFCHDNLIKE